MEDTARIVAKNIMELNKIELKKMTHDFNAISSRMMRVRFDEYNIVLKKFITFIENNEIIMDYINSGKSDEFDAEAEYRGVASSGGRVTFDFGPSLEEETYQIYAVMKYVLESDSNISRAFLMQYGTRKYQEIVKEFNDRVLLVLIQNIEGHLTKVGYEMGMDEKTYWNVSGGQVNIASDNATINATQNNGVMADDVNKMVDTILSNLSGLDKDNAETLTDSVNMIRDELLKPEPKRAIISNGIKLIAPIMTIANGIPTLATNIQSLIDFATKFI